jgi:hypothetical protein
MRKQAIQHKTTTPISDDRITPALRTVFNILQLWKVQVKHFGVLLGVSQPTVYRWKANPAAAAKANSRDLEERLSYLLGIYKALQILLPDPQSADSWVNRPNTAAVFGGRTPLERILGGRVADLYEVRRWLDGQRGDA